MLQKIKDFLFKPKQYHIFVDAFKSFIIVAILLVFLIVFITEIVKTGLLSIITTMLFYVIAFAILTAISCLIIYGIPLILQIITNTVINLSKIIKNKSKGE